MRIWHHRTRHFLGGIMMGGMGGVLLLPTLGLAQSTPHDAEARYTLFDPVPEGQLPEMTADRPDRTDAPFTVAPGHLQIETGLVTYTYDDEGPGDFNEVEVARTNFRLGVLPRVEVALIVEPYIWQRIDADDVGSNGGYGLTAARLKYTLWGQPDGSPGDTAGGIIAAFDFPTGDDDLRLDVEDDVRYRLLLPLQVRLSDDLVLLDMPGIWAAPETDGGGYDPVLVNGVSLDYSVTEDLSTYAEFWAEVNVEQSGDWVGVVGVGTMYQVSDDVQVDVGVEVGVTEEADDLALLTGLSVRL